MVWMERMKRRNVICHFCLWKSEDNRFFSINENLIKFYFIVTKYNTNIIKDKIKKKKFFFNSSFFSNGNLTPIIQSKFKFETMKRLNPLSKFYIHYENNLPKFYTTLVSNNSKACNLLTRLATWFTVVIAKLIVPDVYTTWEVLEGGLRVGSSEMIYRLNFKRGSLQFPTPCNGEGMAGGALY